MGFWKNFIETFDIQGADVYLTGESYAGRYVSYIGAAMLDANNTTYLNLQSTAFTGTLIADHQIQQDLDILSYMDHRNRFPNLNDTFLDTIRYAANACGLNEYGDTYLVYPNNDDSGLDLPSVETYIYGDCEIMW